MQLLKEISELSHKFGTVDYVRGGGGNTSAKDDETLWVKPSGVSLAELTFETFVAMDRKKLARLYHVAAPPEPSVRESLVKDIMAAAVRPGSSGRASVEAPLHNTFDGRFVVHTHPAIVNGMTCAVNGAEVCRGLFPEALWIEYTDPGYTLCMKVRQEIEAYKSHHGREPSVVFLKNHGVFVAGNSPDEIRRSYADIFQTLKKEYQKAHISTRLDIGDLPETDKIDKAKKLLRSASCEQETTFITACGAFDPADGPISPDHIVYSKAFPLLAEPTQEAMRDFVVRYGYTPGVIVWDGVVCGLGTSQKIAALALELAQDGALIKQLAEAFGGIRYMTDEAIGFIEKWEVESYRKTQI